MLKKGSNPKFLIVNPETGEWELCQLYQNLSRDYPDNSEIIWENDPIRCHHENIISLAPGSTATPITKPHPWRRYPKTEGKSEEQKKEERRIYNREYQRRRRMKPLDKVEPGVHTKPSIFEVEEPRDKKGDFCANPFCLFYTSPIEDPSLTVLRNGLKFCTLECADEYDENNTKIADL